MSSGKFVWTSASSPMRDIQARSKTYMGKVKKSCRLGMITDGKLSGFIGRTVYTTKNCRFISNRVQSTHFRFRIQNLWRRDQTGTFFIRILPSTCKRQNDSGTKMFRIRHESGKITSSVNVVSVRNLKHVY